MLQIFQLWFEKNTVSAAEINYVGAVYAEGNISYATN
jgi:hypothetical protein